MTLAARAAATGWAHDPPAARGAGGAVLALAALAIGSLLVRSAQRRTAAAAPVRREWRELHGAVAGLCGSVLADSAVEHYRANFENPGMYTPLAASSLGLLVALDASTACRLPRSTRQGAYALAALVGAAGVGFHVYNVLRRPGGMNWLNLFYAAPLGAPAALGLAGTLGLATQQSVPRQAHEEIGRIAGLPAGRALCALLASGLLGTIGEVGLLHYRGSFHNPFMWLPVSAPSVAAVLTAKAAVERCAPRTRRLTRAWLWLTALLGIAGTGLHSYGVSRAMGGWRNWRQNVLDGPPLPAPPSFSALALAALAALRLRSGEHG